MRRSKPVTRISDEAFEARVREQQQKNILYPLEAFCADMRSGAAMTPTELLFNELIELTKSWNGYDEIPKLQQQQCREVGEKLNAIGGLQLMQDAYYHARAHNAAAVTVQAYWDGVGDWRW